MIVSPFSSFNDYLISKLYREQGSSEDIVIVGIDLKTRESDKSKVGEFNTWHDSVYFEVLEKVRQSKAIVVGLDFELDRDSVYVDIESLRFQELITASPLEIFDFINSNKNFFKKLDSKFFVLGKFKSESGKYENFFDYGLFKSYPNSYFVYKVFGNDGENQGFAYKIAKKVVPDVEIPLDDEGNMIINYYGPAYSYEYVSFSDVMLDNFDPDVFKDKIVLIGPEDITVFKDHHPTPTAQLMPGVEIHANAIQTILEGDFLREQSKTAQVIMTLLLASGLFFLFAFVGVNWATVLLPICIFLFYLSAKIVFRYGIILNVLSPWIAILATYFSAIAYRYFIADKNKRELKSAFEKYVDPSVVSKIADNPSLVKLGGEKKVISIMFTDIESSTSISEKTSTEAWVAQLNEYFTVMESSLKSAGGTLDKFEGDALMGFWNAPLDQPNHVLRAYVAALTMRGELIKLNQKWNNEGKPTFNTRFGINSGEVIVGNFGSENQVNYTAMGDSVNTASRLESAANKAYGTYICVANFEGLLTEDQKSNFVFRELDLVYLPGKKSATKIYELVGLVKNTSTDKIKTVQIYKNALDLYRSKNFEAAAAEFIKIAESDKPASVMLKRCINLLSNLPVKGLDTEQMIFAIEHK